MVERSNEQRLEGVSSRKTEVRRNEASERAWGYRPIARGEHSLRPEPVCLSIISVKISKFDQNFSEKCLRRNSL